MPFCAEENPERNKIINGEINNFLMLSNKSLDYRNAIVHRLGSSDTTLKNIEHCCDKISSYYEKVSTAQKGMFGILQRYRFSQGEINYFYDNR